MDFSKKLKYIRKKEDLTQEELAKRLQVSRQLITKWESGKSLPDILMIKKIADFLKVPVDKLFEDKIEESDEILSFINKNIPIKCQIRIEIGDKIRLENISEGAKEQ